MVQSILRYVGWPRDEVREVWLEQGKWQMDQYGITFPVTDRTDVLIPWHNVIEITHVGMSDAR